MRHLRAGCECVHRPKSTLVGNPAIGYCRREYLLAGLARISWCYQMLLPRSLISPFTLTSTVALLNWQKSNLPVSTVQLRLFYDDLTCPSIVRLTNTALPAILQAAKNLQNLQNLRRGGTCHACWYTQRHANWHISIYSTTPRLCWLGPPAHARVTQHASLHAGADVNE